MPKVSIAQAKARFAALVERAEAGERIIITRHGKPVAQVSALPEAAAIPYGDLARRGFELDDDLTLPEEILLDFEGESL